MSISMLSQGIGLFTFNMDVGNFSLENGGDTVSSVNVYCSKIDRLVNLQVESFTITATSDGNTYCNSLLVLPEQLIPQNDMYYSIFIEVNGNSEPAGLYIKNDGEIRIEWETALDDTQVLNFSNDTLFCISYLV